MGSNRLRAGLLVAAAAAVVASGLVVPSAASAAIIAPTGLTPNDPNAAPGSASSGTPIKNVVLTWTALANVSSYQVQISDQDGSFANPGVDASVGVPSYAPPSTLPRGDYAWRVRATGGIWALPAYFTRGWTDAPGNPHFVGADANNAHGPTLTWDAIPDASYYEVQLSDRPFQQTAYDEAGNPIAGSTPDHNSCYTASTAFAPYAAVQGTDKGITDQVTYKCTELEGGPFYWRVRARDGAFDPRTSNVTAPATACTGVWYGSVPIATAQKDECSNWGYPAVPTFTTVSHVGGTAPGVPTNPDIGPRAGANTSPVQISGTPVLTWDPVPNTSFYRVYQSRTADMNTLDHQWDTTATTLATVVQNPDRLVRTYWSVQACVVSKLINGFVLNYATDETVIVKCSDPTTARSFVQKTPENIQPLSTTAAIDGGRTFTWSTPLDVTKPNGGLSVAVTDVKGYEIQISDNRGSFASPDQSILVDRRGTTTGASSATIATSTLPAAYRWRVRGIDSSDNAREWSGASTAVGTLQSAQASIKTAAGFKLNAPLTVGFDAPVDGVTSSTLKIVAASNGAAMPATVAQSGATTYLVTPTGTWTAGESYKVTVSSLVVDQGNTVPATASTATVRAYTTVDSSSVALTKHTGDYVWTTASSSSALGGSYVRSSDRASTSARSYVQTKVRGSSVAVYACKGTSSGKAGIYIDGTYRQSIDLYNSYSKCDKVATITLSSSAAHTVRLAPLGTKNIKSSSAAVRFDGFVVA